MHAHPLSMVPNGRPSSPYFEALPAQLLRHVLVDPTDRYFEERGNIFSHAHKDDSLSSPLPTLLGLVITRSVPLLSAPSSSSHVFSTVMEKRKAMAEELLTRAESNGYKRGAHRE